MSSRTQDFLAQYYGEAPQPVSDFETKPKKKKVSRAPTKQLQGFKVIDDFDNNEQFEELGPLVSQPSTSTKALNGTTNCVQRKCTLLASTCPHTNYFRHLLPFPILEGPKIIDFTADAVKKELEASQKPAQSFGTLDSSPPRRPRATRHDGTETHTTIDPTISIKSESGDLSPPRRGRANADLSPPRRPASAQADISPPRRSRSGTDSPMYVPEEPIGALPEMAEVKREFDESPPRRARAPATDESPPRRSQRDSDVSPPRRAPREDDIEGRSEQSRDISPPRRRVHRDGDDSPRSTMRMMNGEKAGLQTGAEITAEARRRREEENARLAASAANTVADEYATQTVYRDASGRKISAQQLKQEQEEMMKKSSASKSKWAPKDDVNDEKSDRRGDYDRKEGGRGAGSADREGEKSSSRWGDPLAHLKSVGAIESDEEGENDFEDPMRKFKKRKREHKKEKTSSDSYAGWFPPNRFNLRPGALWDGVDRSNGFEAKMYQAQLNRLHHAEASYRYTSSEM